MRSQIPRGVQDRFLTEAARLRWAEAALRTQFERWGYQEVIPPTFELYDNLAVGEGADLQQAMYRFFDREGYTLALRADFTPQMARIAATKLFDQPMPLRCFYMGSLFRYEEPQAGKQREFTQAGVELIGADTVAGDSEVVALAIAALDALELRDFQVNLGQMAFFRALTAELPNDELTAIRDAIDHKNCARLTAALDRAEVSGARRKLLLRLPFMVGDVQVLEEARRLSQKLVDAASALAALERLAEVYRLLQNYGAVNRVIIDLSEVRGMDYYTGLTFRGVAPGLGWPVVSGGRYNDFIARFGRQMAAVGFGLSVDRVLLLQAQQNVPVPATAPHLLVQGCNRTACLELMTQLRRRGCRVAVDVLGLSATELTEQAQRRGIPRTLRRTGDAWLLSDKRGEHIMTAAAVLHEMEKWLA